MPLEVGDLLCRFVPLELQGDQPLPHLRVVGFHDALLDKFEKLGDASLGVRVGVAEAGEMLLVLVAALSGRSHIRLKHFAKAIRLQDALGDLANDDVVELVHGHTQPLAGDRTFPQLLGAAVVAVEATLPSVLDQGGSAMAAARDPRKQGGAVHYTRRRAARCAALQQPQDRVERLFRHDRRHPHGHPLGRRARASVTAVALVEIVLAEVGGRCQDIVDAPGREPHSPASVAPLVEPSRDGFHAQRASFGSQGHVEDHTDDRSLCVIDNQDLLVLVAAPLSYMGGVTEGRHRTIPEALPGVLAHGAVDMLGVLPRLMFVKDVEHLADEVALCVLTDVLRDRDQPDPALCKLTEVQFRVHGVTAEAAERMHDDVVEWLLATLRLQEHLLEDRSVVFQSRRTGLFEHFSDQPPLTFAIATTLVDLVRKREFVFGLSGGRHTNIDRSVLHTVHLHTATLSLGESVHIVFVPLATL